MNPENNALDRTYFIGGAPRIGKTILSLALAEKVRGHYVSTDSIRNAANKACQDESSDLFILNKMENVSDEEWLKDHNETPEKVVDYQNRESIALWPSLVSFCNSFCEDNAVHIVEGVAMLPSLVAQLENRPRHVFYLGNTSDGHADAMVRFAKSNPEWDWMAASGYGEEKIRAMANFVKKMSEYFKSEAGKYGFPYFEISDDSFGQSISQIIQKAAGKQKSP